MMTAWSKEELCKISEAYDPHIAPFRDAGVMYGNMGETPPASRQVTGYKLEVLAILEDTFPLDSVA